MTDAAVENTDRELWRGPDEGNGSYYADSIHVTEHGGIGINVDGTVRVMPLREWFKMAMDPRAYADVCLSEENDRLIDALKLIATFKGKTLIAPSLGPDADHGHQIGANKAFEQAADIAIAAISSAMREI